MNNHTKFNPGIKIIAFILVVTFLAQDVAWAYPEDFKNLAVPGLQKQEVLSRLKASLVIELIEKRSALKDDLGSIKLDDILAWSHSSETALEGVRFYPIRDKGILKEVTLHIKSGPEDLIIRYFDSNKGNAGPVKVGYTDITDEVAGSSTVHPKSLIRRQVLKAVKLPTDGTVPAVTRTMVPADEYVRYLKLNISVLTYELIKSGECRINAGIDRKDIDAPLEVALLKSGIPQGKGQKIKFIGVSHDEKSGAIKIQGYALDNPAERFMDRSDPKRAPVAEIEIGRIVEPSGGLRDILRDYQNFLFGEIDIAASNPENGTEEVASTDTANSPSVGDGGADGMVFLPTTLCLPLVFVFMPAVMKALEAAGRAFKRIVTPAGSALDLSTGSMREGKKLGELYAEIDKTRRSGAMLFGGTAVSAADMGSHYQVLVSAVPKNTGSPEDQLKNLLSNIDRVLRENGCDGDSVIKQAVFMRSASLGNEARRIIGEYFQRGPPPTSYILQPPAGGESFSMEILAIRPKKGRDVRIERPDENITIVHDGRIRRAYIAGLEPSEGITGTFEQALDTFRRMGRLLKRHGFGFDRVLRTWIYERDITKSEVRDGKAAERYAQLNHARAVFFDEIGLVRIKKDIMEILKRPPASTGIGMSEGTFVMECLAADLPEGDTGARLIENPEQTSAFEYSTKVLKPAKDGQVKYPPLFSRGISVGDELLVSGTASIKGQETVGKTVEEQTRVTIENIALVLGQAGSGLKDVKQLRVYIKRKEDYEKVRAVVEAALPSVPSLYLNSDVCRDDLLVEIEAAAYKKSPQPSYNAGAAGEPEPLIRNGMRVSVIPDESYDVLMTRDVFNPENTLLAERIAGRKAFFVVDKGVGPERIAALKAYIAKCGIDADPDRNIFVVSGGERVKDGLKGFFYTLWICCRALKMGLDRKSVFVLTGGGATLDMSGFGATIFHRGAAHIRIPSTLLSQDDAGVGVKNGINFFSQKNLIGTFKTPETVIVDPLLLRTADRKIMSDGLAEIIKVTLMKDRKGFESLEANYNYLLDLPRLLSEKENVVPGSPTDEALKTAEDLIYLSIVNHLNQIKTDPYERKLARPLDYGHEWAHRLESVSRHRLSHGQGVAIGMAIDSHISWKRGYITRSEFERIINLISACGLPVWDRAATFRNVWASLEEFRRHLGGDLTISLLGRQGALPGEEGIGFKQDVHDIKKEEVRDALVFLRGRTAGEPRGGMIPVLWKLMIGHSGSKFFKRDYIWRILGNDAKVKTQVLIEQGIGWGMAVGLSLIPQLGITGALAVTWSLFFLLHLVPAKGMPNAPPLKGAAAISLLNAAAIFIVLTLQNFIPQIIDSPVLSGLVLFISSAFLLGLTTAIHHKAVVLVLRQKQKIDRIAVEHLKAYHRIRALRPDLWDAEKNRFVYTITDPDYAVGLVRRLKARGYLTPGTSFADLGSGDGYMVHLVNAMTEGVRTTGYEKDKDLYNESEYLNGILSAPDFIIGQGPAIDKNRAVFIKDSYFLADLAGFDVLYIYPPMRAGPGEKALSAMIGNSEYVWNVGPAVDLAAVIRKMKPGAILVLNGGFSNEIIDGLKFTEDVEYIPEVDACLKISNRQVMGVAGSAKWPSYKPSPADGALNRNSAVEEDGDTTNPIILRHIAQGKAIEIDEKKEAVKIIRLGDRHPSDALTERELESHFRSNGVFSKIRKAKDPRRLRIILEGNPEFGALTEKQKRRLLGRIVQDIRLSVILGEAVIGERGDSYIVSHARTGFGRRHGVHQLEDTIWAGEAQLSRLTYPQLARLLLEEGHHILKPPTLVKGKWINMDAEYSPGERPDRVVDHGRFFRTLDCSPARPGEVWPGRIKPEINLENARSRPVMPYSSANMLVGRPAADGTKKEAGTPKTGIARSSMRYLYDRLTEPSNIDKTFSLKEIADLAGISPLTAEDPIRRLLYIGLIEKKKRRFYVRPGLQAYSAGIKTLLGHFIGTNRLLYPKFDELMPARAAIERLAAKSAAGPAPHPAVTGKTRAYGLLFHEVHKDVLAGRSPRTYSLKEILQGKNMASGRIGMERAKTILGKLAEANLVSIKGDADNPKYAPRLVDTDMVRQVYEEVRMLDERSPVRRVNRAVRKAAEACDWPGFYLRLVTYYYRYGYRDMWKYLPAEDRARIEEYYTGLERVKILFLREVPQIAVQAARLSLRGKRIDEFIEIDTVYRKAVSQRDIEDEEDEEPDEAPAYREMAEVMDEASRMIYSTSRLHEEFGLSVRGEYKTDPEAIYRILMGRVLIGMKALLAAIADNDMTPAHVEPWSISKKVLAVRILNALCEHPYRDFMKRIFRRKLKGGTTEYKALCRKFADTAEGKRILGKLGIDDREIPFREFDENLFDIPARHAGRSRRLEGWRLDFSNKPSPDYAEKEEGQKGDEISSEEAFEVYLKEEAGRHAKEKEKKRTGKKLSDKPAPTDGVKGAGGDDIIFGYPDEIEQIEDIPEMRSLDKGALDAEFGAWDETAGRAIAGKIKRDMAGMFEAICESFDSADDTDGRAEFIDRYRNKAQVSDEFKAAIRRIMADPSEPLTISIRDPLPLDDEDPYMHIGINRQGLSLDWLDRFEQLRERYYRLNQWDFLNRFPGARGIRLWRGVWNEEEGASYTDDIKGKIIDVRDSFFSFIPEHAEGFAGYEIDTPLVVMFVPVTSIRETCWVGPSEPQILVSEKALFIDALRLGETQDKRRYKIMKGEYEKAAQKCGVMKAAGKLMPETTEHKPDSLDVSDINPGSPIACLDSIRAYCISDFGRAFKAEDLIKEGIRKRVLKNGKEKDIAVSTVRRELRQLKALGILKNTDKKDPYKFMLRSEIRNLSPPRAGRVLTNLASLMRSSFRDELARGHIPRDALDRIRPVIEETIAAEALPELKLDITGLAGIVGSLRSFGKAPDTITLARLSKLLGIRDMLESAASQSENSNQVRNYLFKPGAPDGTVPKNGEWLTPEEATKRLDALPTIGSFERLARYYDEADKNDSSTAAFLKGLYPEMEQAAEILKNTRPLDELSVMVERAGVGVAQLDILRAVSELILQLLPKKIEVDNNLRLKEIKDVFARHPGLSKLLIRYFEKRFDPQIDLDTRGEEAGNLRIEILDMLDSLDDKPDDCRVLQTALGIMVATVKTDYYVPDRTELFLKMDPRALVIYDRSKALVHTPPYALIWVHVPYGAFGAHSRYSDVARGGVRCIRPERTALMDQVLTECILLSITQHRKHIDIPEGGSKGAYIYRQGLNPVAASIGYIDGLINCMMTHERIAVASGSGAVDPLELGPDVLTSDLVNLATVRAWAKELDGWRLLMTGKSKSLGGISHKKNNLLLPPERGNRVTSQGVMEHAFGMIRYLRDKGRIKSSENEPVIFSMTGGLDGDVGSGNVERAIAHYGPLVKIRSISDVSGVIFDPEGLDHAALLEMYKNESRSTAFPISKLGKGGLVIEARRGAGVDSYVVLREDSLRAMNTMALDPDVLEKLGVEAKYKEQAGLKEDEPLIRVLKRDAGGRPIEVEAHSVYIRDAIFFLTKSDMLITGNDVRNSIDSNNWTLFFDQEGRSVSTAITHGANVFIEKEAGVELEKKGVVIEPDDKANSVGVEISSRMEIDFNAIFRIDEISRSLMSAYFEQVLRKCLENARWKFWALRVESEDRPGESVVARVSPAMSTEIIRLSDVITHSGFVGERKDSYAPELLDRLRNYFPDVTGLDRGYASKTTLDRIFDRMSAERIKSAASKMLAKEAVFNLGMGAVSRLARSEGVKEIDVIKRYLEQAARLGTYSKVNSIIENKERLSPGEQIARLRAVRREINNAVVKTRLPAQPAHPDEDIPSGAENWFWTNGELLEFDGRYGLWITGDVGAGKSYLAMKAIESDSRFKSVSCGACYMSVGGGHDGPALFGRRQGQRNNIIFSRLLGNKVVELSKTSEIRVNFIVILDRTRDDLLDNMFMSGLGAKDLGVRVIDLSDVNAGSQWKLALGRIEDAIRESSLHETALSSAGEDMQAEDADGFATKPTPPDGTAPKDNEITDREYREALLADEPVAKDYMEMLFKLNLELYTLGYEALAAEGRITRLQKEMDGAPDPGERKRLRSRIWRQEKKLARIKRNIKRFGKRAEKEVAEFRKPKYRGAAVKKYEDYRGRAKRHFIEAVRLMLKDRLDEKTIEAFRQAMGRAINNIKKDREWLIGRRLARKKGAPRVHVERRDGKIVVLQRYYVKKKGSKTPILVHKKVEYDYLWDAMRARDHEIESEIGNTGWLEPTIGRLREAKDLLSRYEASPMSMPEEERRSVSRRISAVLRELKGVKAEEMRFSKIALGAAVRLTNIAKIDTAKGLIEAAARMFEARRNMVEDMIESIKEGRLGELRGLARFRNNDIRNRADRVVDLLRRGKDKEALASLRGLKGLKWMREPEYTGLDNILRQSAASIESGWPNKGLINDAMSIVKTRADNADTLCDFMEDYRDLYEQWLAGKEPGLNTGMDVFRFTFHEYLAAADRIRGKPDIDRRKSRELSCRRVREHPRAFWTRFYQAAFIPLNIDDPAGRKDSRKKIIRVLNPACQAVSDLVLIQVLPDLNRIIPVFSRKETYLVQGEKTVKKPARKETVKALKELRSRGKKNFIDLTLDERRLVEGALAADYGLEGEDLRQFNSAILKISDSELERWKASGPSRAVYKPAPPDGTAPMNHSTPDGAAPKRALEKKYGDALWRGDRIESLYPPTSAYVNRITPGLPGSNARRGQAIREGGAHQCNYIIVTDLRTGKSALIHSSVMSPEQARQTLVHACKSMGVDAEDRAYANENILAMIARSPSSKLSKPYAVLADRTEQAFTGACADIGIRRLETDYDSAWRLNPVIFLVDEGLLLAVNAARRRILRSVDVRQLIAGAVAGRVIPSAENIGQTPSVKPEPAEEDQFTKKIILNGEEVNLEYMRDKMGRLLKMEGIIFNIRADKDRVEIGISPGVGESLSFGHIGGHGWIKAPEIKDKHVFRGTITDESIFLEPVIWNYGKPISKEEKIYHHNAAITIARFFIACGVSRSLPIEHETYLVFSRYFRFAKNIHALGDLAILKEIVEDGSVSQGTMSHAEGRKHAEGAIPQGDTLPEKKPAEYAPSKPSPPDGASYTSLDAGKRRGIDRVNKHNDAAIAEMLAAFLSGGTSKKDTIAALARHFLDNYPDEGEDYAAAETAARRIVRLLTQPMAMAVNTPGGTEEPAAAPEGDEKEEGVRPLAGEILPERGHPFPGQTPSAPVDVAKKKDDLPAKGHFAVSAYEVADENVPWRGAEIRCVAEQGKRPAQEDRFVSARIGTEGFPHCKGQLMAVMDGSGGSAETAEKVQEHIVSYFESALADTQGDVEKTLRKVADRLRELTRYDKTLTTLSTVYIPDDEPRAYGLFLGDSPIVIRGKGGQVYVNPMHSVLTHVKDREEAVERGASYDGGNSLIYDEALITMTRALGAGFFFPILNPEPDIFSIELDEKSAVMIASDGIFYSAVAEVPTPELLQTLDELSGGRDMAELAREKSRRYGDNLTVLLWAPAESSRRIDASRMAGEGAALLANGELSVKAEDGSEFIFKISFKKPGRDGTEEGLMLDIFAKEGPLLTPVGYAHAVMFEGDDWGRTVSLRHALEKNRIIETTPSLLSIYEIGAPALYVADSGPYRRRDVASCAVSLLAQVAQLKKAYRLVAEDVDERKEWPVRFYSGQGFKQFPMSRDTFEFPLKPEDMIARGVQFHRVEIKAPAATAEEPGNGLRVTGNVTGADLRSSENSYDDSSYEYPDVAGAVKADWSPLEIKYNLDEGEIRKGQTDEEIGGRLARLAADEPERFATFFEVAQMVGGEILASFTMNTLDLPTDSARKPSPPDGMATKGIQNMAWLLQRPAGYDWSALAGRQIDGINGLVLGITEDSKGTIDLEIRKGCGIRWRIPGVKEGWRAMVLGHGIIDGSFQFLVELTKKGNSPRYRFFRIGRKIRRLSSVIEADAPAIDARVIAPLGTTREIKRHDGLLSRGYFISSVITRDIYRIPDGKEAADNIDAFLDKCDARLEGWGHYLDDEEGRKVKLLGAEQQQVYMYALKVLKLSFAAELLMASQARTVVQHVRNVRRKHPNIDIDDLMGHINTRLYKALDKWRFEKGASFSTYATTSVELSVNSFLQMMKNKKHRIKHISLSMDDDRRGEHGEIVIDDKKRVVGKRARKESDGPGEELLTPPARYSAQQKGFVRRRIEDLPEDMRKVMSLVYQQGISIDQAALKLGTTVEEAEIRRREGVKLLRKLAEEEGIGWRSDLSEERHLYSLANLSDERYIHIEKFMKREDARRKLGESRYRIIALRMGINEYSGQGPKTMDETREIFGLSRERIRQKERAALLMMFGQKRCEDGEMMPQDTASTLPYQELRLIMDKLEINARICGLVLRPHDPVTAQHVHGLLTGAESVTDEMLIRARMLERLESPRRLKRIREELEMDEALFAETLGVTRDDMQEMERGGVMVPSRVMEKANKAFLQFYGRRLGYSEEYIRGLIEEVSAQAETIAMDEAAGRRKAYAKAGGKKTARKPSPTDGTAPSYANQQPGGGMASEGKPAEEPGNGLRVTGNVTGADLRPAVQILPLNAPDSVPIAQPFMSGAEVGLVPGSVGATIGAIDTQFKEVQVRSNAAVLLSENLFIADGDRTELDDARIALKPILDSGVIAILSPEEIQTRVRRNPSKDKMAVVLGREDYESNKIWKSEDERILAKASILIMDDKLTGTNYLYLQGVVGLARAIMANNKPAISYYYKMLSGMAIDYEILKLLDSEGWNNIAFALKAILRFRDPGKLDAEEFKVNRIRMETLLMAA